ncbi:MAG: DEAD/DEAH box helicase family protein [Syntrophobacteraceae bacterium]|jgi:superfamily II DNA or RNA helicase
MDKLLTAAEQELAKLDVRRAEILQQIQQLKLERDSASRSFPDQPPGSRIAAVTNESDPEEKIGLFQRLFRGREDVYPRRFESAKTGKTGYQPACHNEWIRPFCKKPKIRCGECINREFLPVTDEVIRNHLRGTDRGDKSRKDFTIGVYPLLPDETCWFLAVDFDKKSWMEDIGAVLEVCKSFDVPAAVERSRSGNGGHLWIFFSSPVPAAPARQIGSFILTEAMETRPEIGLDSYDRFFPNQDTMPKGGLGNLIALPLQRNPRENGNSMFVDEHFRPYADQWAFLSSVRRMDRSEVEKIVFGAVDRGRVIGVRTVPIDEEDEEPWTAPPSKRRKEPPIQGPLPEKLNLILGNQIYIENKDLTPALRNRLIRLAAFQNPAFYKAQAMRLPTFQLPRIICCCEDFSQHIGIPRGCLEEVVDFLKSFGVEPAFVDERFCGTPVDLKFQGVLKPDQQVAANSLLAHDTGVLSAPTAFGKTVVAAHLIAERKVNALVLVHRRQLLDQWVSRLSALLGLSSGQIGQIGGGKRKDSGVVDVAIIQSLFRNGVVDDLIGEYGHLIVDECHHVSAKSFETVARQCKARYVTGLSATVTRKDGHHPIILMQCGPIRYHVDERRQAVERPFKHRVIVRKTGFSLPGVLQSGDDLAIHELYSALVSDEQRTELIVQDILGAVESGRCPVVLTERKEHLSILLDRLARRISNVIVLKGGMGRKERKLAADKLTGISGNEPRVIIATGRYLGEGFDDARLDTLFLALPVSWRGVLAQYAGRLHRLHESKKEVIVYDYADLSVPMLAKMYGRRRLGYRRIGYVIEEHG